MTDSCGSRSMTARATVSPPTPESKMPMGRGSMTGDDTAAAGPGRGLGPQLAAEAGLGGVRVGPVGAGGQVLPAAVGREDDDLGPLQALGHPQGDLQDGPGGDAGGHPLGGGQLPGGAPSPGARGGARGEPTLIRRSSTVSTKIGATNPSSRLRSR